MRGAVVSAIVLCLSLGTLEAPALAKPLPAGQTRIQLLTVIDSAAVPARGVARVEHAVTAQSRHFARWWHTPVAQFGAGGWPIYLGRHAATLECGTFGCHLPNPPAGYVDTMEWIPGLGIPPQPWSITFSHEVLEMLVDPEWRNPLFLRANEPCDVTYRLAYRSRPGAPWLQDFALPAWYRKARSRRLDFLGELRRDGSLDHSGPNEKLLGATTTHLILGGSMGNVTQARNLLLALGG